MKAKRYENLKFCHNNELQSVGKIDFANWALATFPPILSYRFLFSLTTLKI